MRFTKYYSDLIKASGVPRLTPAQLQRINNIMVMEIRINEQTLIAKHLSGDAKVLLNKRSYHCYSQLNNLTQGKGPEELLKAILRS